MTITTKQTPTTYRNFYLKRERVIHLFQDGSRKEARAGGEAAYSGLESSDRVDNTLSPGLCCPACVPAPWSKFIELINSFSYLSSLGQPGQSWPPCSRGHRVYGECVNVC